jgi:MFS superfamily sulfate permease-like transporter
MAVVEDMLCLMTTVMMPLMMNFIQGILFGMCLVDSQETQVVCR